MNKRVLVAMSGGVDSSVTLLKILEEGYEPVGVTMKLWESTDADGTPSTDSYCCSVEAINNAKLICDGFGVPHYTLDFKSIFRENVVDYLVDQYFVGITPNPCVECNVHLRWGALFHHADQLDAHWIATGHYARIDSVDGIGPVIRKGIDDRKDQSYVLWGIDRELIGRTLFPLGEFRKLEVRAIAEEAGLVTARIAESQELCFLPDADYRRFLREYTPDRSKAEQEGLMLSTGGETIGRHRGLSQYTIGQRKGLGISGPEPSYVQHMDRENNTVTVGSRNDLYFPSCSLAKLNWLVSPEYWPKGKIQTHIRYNHHGVKSEVELGENATAAVSFESPQFAVTPGQSAVFYVDDLLLGGGIITEAGRSKEQNGLDNHS
ncbi:MAG: tRNA 2-thiouridine(34) synthase MnmA [Candidatus Marinimicrobia bacterium]|nr:tRNA 2-thiouridine(34) synthase MnmA [Candidatus Neomarinimicrobiota bacterium]|tara:strand:- start:2915 stop:4045 length:1131 start_codon:yes stop_codon:yes gene_type:complete